MSRRGPLRTPHSPRRVHRTLQLRPWQRAALDGYLRSNDPDFLAVATPGAGKTTFALTAARLTLPDLRGRLVVVAPTRHLKLQWAAAELDASPGRSVNNDFLAAILVEAAQRLETHNGK